MRVTFTVLPPTHANTNNNNIEVQALAGQSGKIDATPLKWMAATGRTALLWYHQQHGNSVAKEASSVVVVARLQANKLHQQNKSPSQSEEAFIHNILRSITYRMRLLRRNRISRPSQDDDDVGLLCLYLSTQCVVVPSTFKTFPYNNRQQLHPRQSLSSMADTTVMRMRRNNKFGFVYSSSRAAVI